MESAAEFGFKCSPGYWVNQWLLFIAKRRSKASISVSLSAITQRIADINAAVAVNTARGKEIPMEWIDELGDLVKSHNGALIA